MSVAHVLDGVGDDVARGQRIQHAVMAHGDAIVHRDGIEFLADATGFLDFLNDALAHILEVYMAGNELSERVGDRNDGLAEITIFHAGGAPERAGTGHVAAKGGSTGTIGWHVLYPRRDAGIRCAARG